MKDFNFNNTVARKIAILGSTGSIGTQTLDIIRRFPQKFCAEILTAHKNADLLIQQALEFQPNCVVISDDNLYSYVKKSLEHTDVKVFGGKESLNDAVTFKSVDIVVSALVGFAGLEPTFTALKHGKTVALANKETLVAAGDVITKTAIENSADILPVDSEHSAIFQCLAGEYHNPIRKILLTASGGPFLGKKPGDLEHITPNDALKNPNWQMGAKVTIDSSTLMNKGLEVIEAKWLFDIKDVNDITAVIHPQSIIHSMVEFSDGCIKAQLSKPDMRLPIMYTLSYPERQVCEDFTVNIFDIPNLSFQKPDTDTFPCLNFAYQALDKGGNMPCIMNAANEIAVQKFLQGKIKFLQIPELIAKAMQTFPVKYDCTIEDYIQTDTMVKQSLK